MSVALARPAPPPALDVERARDQLARAKDFAEVKGIRDKAAAVLVYQRSIKAGIDAQQDAAEIILMATRRMGQILADMPTAPNGRKKKGASVAPFSKSAAIEDLGIGESDAKRAQRLAAIPESRVSGYVTACREKGQPVTRAGALALDKEPKPDRAFHALVSLGEFKDAIRRLVSRWPEEERIALPEALRDLAAEVEEDL